jgi:NAD(P)H dehydrogenase (quinone)
MYLVTGAAGHLGSLTIASLIADQKVAPKDIIATTRKPEALAALAKQGVAVRAADFDQPESLAKAFAGATRLLLISTDALDRPGRRLEQHRRAVAAAAKAGVRHILYTSMPKPETSAVTFAPDHLGTERAIAESGIPGWTLLRNNWYFENLFYSVPQALAAGSWYSAAGDGRIAHIGRADLARAAAAALAASNSGQTTYTLTGARAYSTAELAGLIAAATGKPLSVVPVDAAALIQGMVAHGLPEAIAQVFASFDTNIRQGGLADVTGDFARLTGQQPTPFETWLEVNTSAFAGAADQKSAA